MGGFVSASDFLGVFWVKQAHCSHSPHPKGKHPNTKYLPGGLAMDTEGLYIIGQKKMHNQLSFYTRCQL